MLYELRELNFYEICRTEEMESPKPSDERVEDRKCLGDIDPDRIDVTGGDPKVGDRKNQGDNESDRNGITGGDPKVDDRKDQCDIDPDCVSVTGAIRK